MRIGGPIERKRNFLWKSKVKVSNLVTSLSSVMVFISEFNIKVTIAILSLCLRPECRVRGQWIS
eukprot:527488-Amorphochlora_amoeboformis.AAC.1